MNAPGSIGPRPHDHGEWRPDPAPDGEPESPGQDPRAAGSTPERSTAGPDPGAIPSTPGELIAMQRLLGERQPSPPRSGESRVALALALLEAQDLKPWESQQIALALLQHLESYHQAVVAELHESPQGTAAQVACWAIDGDRLMHCRRLLESITLI